MIARRKGLALRGFLLTGAASLAFCAACLAQEPQSIKDGKYNDVSAPQSLTVYAPVMKKEDLDALILKAVLIGAAGLGAIIGLIVWKVMPPKTDAQAAGTGQNVAATTTEAPAEGSKSPSAEAQEAAPKEEKDAAKAAEGKVEANQAADAEKPADAEKTADSDGKDADESDVDKAKDETADANAATEGKSES